MTSQKLGEGELLLGRLNELLPALMEHFKQRDGDRVSKYWYPLSYPTYGVEEILSAIESMCAFQTTMWHKTRQFEREFAKYIGCQDCVMVNSGSSADLLLAFALGGPIGARLRRGDEILMPAVTWPTQIWSAMMAGFRVRLVDVNPRTLNIDIGDLQRKITPDSKAIFLVHLMGNPCQMDRILEVAKEGNLLILEDCCEALSAEWDGIKVGNFGVGGAFSFFFSHHMTTMEGGMVSCPDTQMADRIRRMRAHGWLRSSDGITPYPADDGDLDPRYVFVDWGFNVRPTELQAGFGLHQLQKLESFNKQRSRTASRFFSYIDSTGYLMRPEVHEKAVPCWFALPIMLRDDAPFLRVDLTRHLEESGVETRPIVAGNIVRQPIAKAFADLCGTHKGANIIHERGFYIGLSPVHREDAVTKLIDCFQQFLDRYAKRRRPERTQQAVL